jgi:hypothetical protein
MVELILIAIFHNLTKLRTAKTLKQEVPTQFEQVGHCTKCPLKLKLKTFISSVSKQEMSI